LDSLETATIIKQVLSAIYHMHDHANIVHRDLKLENILLERPNDITDLKVIDFGTSKKFFKSEEGTTHDLYERCGTL
jgi:serine/threonine protein kinase